MFKTLAVISAAALMLCGCSPMMMLQKYDTVRPELNIPAGTRLAIGVRDIRPAIMNGEQSPFFTGIRHSGSVVCYHVYTDNELSFADNIAGDIGRSLKEKGVHVTVYPIPSGMQEADAVRKLSEGNTKSVLISLLEWKSWTFNKTELDYDLHIGVYGTDGKKLAEKRLAKHEELGGGPVKPWEHATYVLPKTLQQQIEMLFGDKEIARQLH